MKQSFADIRPDLAKYYKPELNDGRPFSNCSKWATVILVCDICNKPKKVQGGNFTTDNKLTRSFSCNYCLSLGVLEPEIAKEWHPTKNGKLTPFDVKRAYNKKVWWLCSEGHEWEAGVGKRTVMRRNCPVCGYSRAEQEIVRFLNKAEIEYVTQYFARVNGRKAFFDIYT